MNYKEKLYTSLIICADGIGLLFVLLKIFMGGVELKSIFLDAVKLGL